MFKSIIKKIMSQNDGPQQIIENSLRDLNESIPKANDEISLLKQKSMKAKALLAEKEEEHTALLLKLENYSAEKNTKVAALEKKIAALQNEITEARNISRKYRADYGKALDARDEFLGVIHARMNEASEKVTDMHDSQWKLQRQKVLSRLNQVSVSAKKNKQDHSDDPVKFLKEYVPLSASPIRQTLEEIIYFAQRILDDVASHPDHVNRCRMFLNFYLDSTVNIVKGYIELQDMAVNSETIDNSLKRAEKLLVSVRNAFESLLVKLAEDEVMNLEVELSVLEKTLHHEGL